MIDVEPPTVASDALLVAAATGRAVSVWAANDTISAYWEFLDAHTGIASVRYAVVAAGAAAPAFAEMVDAPLPSTMLGGELPLPSPLAHGANYTLHVCAADFVGLAVCSPPYPFAVDLTPPSCAPPTDLVDGATAATYFSYPGAIAAGWSCDDPESGVAYVEFTALADGAPLRTHPAMHAGGAGGASGAAPMEGVTYSSCVVAYNGAGIASAPACRWARPTTRRRRRWALPRRWRVVRRRVHNSTALRAVGGRR